MIEIKGLCFSYDPGAFALDVPELCIARGERAAFVGPSGTGKTTLIHLIAGILVPDTGFIHVGDFDLTSQPENLWRVFRISRVGPVFQEFELLDDVRLIYEYDASGLDLLRGLGPRMPSAS